MQQQEQQSLPDIWRLLQCSANSHIRLGNCSPNHAYIRNCIWNSIVILILITKFQTMLYAQTVQQRQWSIANGLPSEHVLGLAKAPDGHLLVATARGIVRFDGYRFRSFPGNNSSATTLVVSGSNIYSSTNLNGIVIFKNEQRRVLVAPNFQDAENNNDHFDNLFVDTKGRIWCSDFSGLKVYTDKGALIHRKEIAPNQNKPLRLQFFESSRGVVFAVSESGLYQFDNQLFQFKKIAEIKGSAVVGDVQEDNFYLLTDNQIYLFNAKMQSLGRYLAISDSVHPIGIQLRNNKPWVYNKSSLCPTDCSTGDTAIRIEEHPINTALYDSQHQCWWIGSNHGLIQIIDAPTFLQTFSLHAEKKLQSGIITQISMERGSSIICSDGVRLWRIDPSGHTNRQRIPEGTEVYFLGNDRIGESLVASNTGVHKLFNNKLTAPLVKVPLRWICATRETYWCIDTANHIRVFDSNWVETPKYLSGDKETVRKENIWHQIRQTDDGKIWLAGYMPSGFGILVYSPGLRCFSRANPFNADSLFIGDYYLSISPMSGNCMLASGYGGINLFDSNGKIQLRLGVENHPLRSENIRSVAYAGANCVVAGTPEGLHCINLRNRNIVVLDQVSGLPFNDCSAALISKAATGEVWLGGLACVVRINIHEALKPKWQNRLSVTEITADGKYYPLTDSQYRFPAGTKQINLAFSAFTFRDAEKTKFQYRINKGIWQLLNGVELQLNSPSAGDYIIDVRALDNLDNIQAHQLHLNIKVAPFYYQTWLFVLLTVLVLMGATLAITLYIYTRKQRIEALRRQVQITEMQVLRTQMNPHFLFNALNALKSMILEDRSASANEYLNKFSKLLRNILENSTRQTISLSLELQTLEWYLQLEQTRMGNGFSYEIEIDPKIDPDTLQVPPLIIQPFAENAIWHGLRQKKWDGKVCIKTTQMSQTSVEIQIQDNGVGRTLHQNQGAGVPKSHQNKGISISEKRLKMLHPENSLQIRDLYDSIGNASGTLVMLKIYNEQ